MLSFFNSLGVLNDEQAYSAERGICERARGRGLWRRKPARAASPSLVREICLSGGSGVCGVGGQGLGSPTNGAEAARRVRRLGAGAFALALTLVCTVFGSFAFAFSAGIFAESSNAVDGTRAFMINAPNRYDAAAYALGYEADEVDRWDLTVRAKLSNASTGGAFYALVQKVEAYGATFADYPSWANGFWGSAFIESWGSMSVGTSPDCFFLLATNTELTAAREDLRTVLSGGSLGGGGGSGTTQRTIMKAFYRNSTSNPYLVGDYSFSPKYITNHEGTEYTLFADNSTLAFNDAILANAPVSLDDYDVICELDRNSDTTMRFRMYLFPKDSYDLEVTSSFEDNNVSYDSAGKLTWSGVGYEWAGYDLESGGTNSSTNVLLTLDADTNGFTYASALLSVNFDRPVRWSRTTATSRTISGGSLLSGFGYVGPPAPTPPNNWPDDDPTPTPTPPDPPEPTEPTPTPTPEPPLDPINPTGPTIPYEPEPDPPTPITPFIVQEPTNTSPTDYTPWLRAILLQLQEIDTDIVDGSNLVASELDKHCIHLQDALGDWVQWLDQSLQLMINNQRLSLQSYLRYLFDDLAARLINAIDDAIYELELYLREQMEWLASQFDFSFTGYDDSSVVSWLRRIYSKLEFDSWHYPVGKPTEKDVENGFDWWSWLIDTLVSLLGKGAADGIDTLVGILEELNRLFPFSIPWDLVAIFTAIVAQPVTPVFDVVIPAIDGWWSEVTFHVDLQPYDGAAAAVRAMWLLWFAVCLAMRTDWLVGVFETGARVVTQFLDRL